MANRANYWQISLFLDWKSVWDLLEIDRLLKQGKELDAKWIRPAEDKNLELYYPRKKRTPLGVNPDLLCAWLATNSASITTLHVPWILTLPPRTSHPGSSSSPCSRATSLSRSSCQCTGIQRDMFEIGMWNFSELWSS